VRVSSAGLIVISTYRAGGETHTSQRARCVGHPADTTPEEYRVPVRGRRGAPVEKTISARSADGPSEVWTHPDSQAVVFLVAVHAFALLLPAAVHVFALLFALLSGSDAVARPAAFLSRQLFVVVVLFSDLAAHDSAAFDLAADLPFAGRVGFADPAGGRWCSQAPSGRRVVDH
jgi:hypothetical protein